MLEITLEILRFCVLSVALGLFIHADRTVTYGRRGFLLIKIGFLLILFGIFMEITNKLDIPGWAMVGDVHLHIYLAKLLGQLAGSILLLAGLWFWLPSIRTMDEVRDELDRARSDLEEHFLARTRDLEQEVDRRCKAEAEGRIADERRRILFENSPVGITHGFVGGRFVERNKAYARMLGYDSPEEMAQAQALAGDTFSHMVDPADEERIVNLARTEDAVQGLTVRMRRKDGAIRWIRLDMAMARDHHGQNYYFYAFALDKTESRERAEALARSKRRLKGILHSLPVGVFVVDLKRHTLVDANPEALAMSGHTRQELVGQPCGDILCGDTDLCPWRTEDGHVEVEESFLVRKDGTRLPVLKNMVSTVVDGRESMVVSVQDISEQKRLEELRADVDRIVTHDLKAPIIGVIDGCRLLLMEEERLDGELSEMLHLIEHQAEKALRLIGLSLTLYRIEAGTYAYEPEPTDLMAVIREALGNLGGRIADRGQTVAVSLDGRPDDGRDALVVPANPLLLETMVSNLLLNAVEAAPDGGAISVRVAPGDPTVLVIANPGAVPGSLRETFFDKYATHGKQGGTGLGTYSARLAATAMGGAIALEVSDAEDRTTLRVTLPGA
ncbi:multi-sensor signal transduction histidine kinase [Pseudodesulfovibrio mercurii]|uniref:histidine kinase n=1 Tax=Pseudodesulfovibrio mercurii TaxID=641491 RepID=F0JGB6_9BACT|nr:PAS domain S-box protein [Pseudodesulfovibrio mercurii]EGB15033.1 multi-sensor signal transduction histidine kinase [Pseudodesulfovibrio mercurii]